MGEQPLDEIRDYQGIEVASRKIENKNPTSKGGENERKRLSLK